LRTWQQAGLGGKIAGLALVAFLVAGGAIGVWLAAPLFYDRTVDEAFPTAAPVVAAAPTSAPAPTSIPAPTAAPAAATARVEPTTAPAPTAEPEPTAIPAPTAVPEPIVLVMGSFVAGSVPGDTADGTATIYQLADGSRLLRLEEFSATNGPDLFVALSSSANPDRDGLRNSEWIQLEALKGNQGYQNYALPADLDLSLYRTVVIWCRTFDIVFGYALVE
jgi:hypothetical protein